MSRRILVVLSALCLTGLLSAAASAQANQASDAARSASDTTIRADSAVAFPFYACNGERVDLQGMQHVVGHIVQDPSGITRLALHVTFSDMKGTGEVTGAKYVLSSPQKEMDVETDASGSSTFMMSLVLVGQGSAPNTVMHVVQAWSWSPTSFTFNTLSSSTSCH